LRVKKQDEGAWKGRTPNNHYFARMKQQTSRVDTKQGSDSSAEVVSGREKGHQKLRFYGASLLTTWAVPTRSRKRGNRQKAREKFDITKRRNAKTGTSIYRRGFTNAFGSICAIVNRALDEQHLPEEQTRAIQRKIEKISQIVFYGEGNVSGGQGWKVMTKLEENNGGPLVRTTDNSNEEVYKWTNSSPQSRRIRSKVQKNRSHDRSRKERGLT